MLYLKPSAVVKWTLTLGVVGAMLFGAYAMRYWTTVGGGTPAAESKRRKLEAGRIKLGAALAQQSIKVEPAQDIEWIPQVAVYGRVVPNPLATNEIRAAFGGRLRAADNVSWPKLGSHLKAAALLGAIDVRVGPQDRLDLESKVVDARLKLVGAKKVESICRARVVRFKAAENTLARGDFDAAQVALAEAETQVATADAVVQQYESALTALNLHGELRQWTLPLTAPAEGEIVELPGQPGTVVESGGLIAKIVDFSKALVRVDVPLHLSAAPPPETLDLFVLPPTPPALSGPTNRPEPADVAKPVAAKRQGIAGQVDPTLQAAGYLYEIEPSPNDGQEKMPANLWRPGLFVKALLKVSEAKPVSAIAVAQSALLFHQGRALVYRQVGNTPGVYQRVEVAVLGRTNNAWIVTGDLVEGDPVVTQGALLLLSEEFRADVDD